jgi:hypothetical protein
MAKRKQKWSVANVQDDLYKYLSTEIDPYDFNQYLSEWVEDSGVEGLGDEPYVEELDPKQLAAFEKWLVDTDKAADYVTNDPFDAPAYLTFGQVKNYRPVLGLFISRTAIRLSSLKRALI